MLPTYRAGDLLLGSRWARPRLGRVVVARHERPLIKRVTRVDEDGYFLAGDNEAASTDSRTFGVVPRDAIEAVVLFRLIKAG